MKKYYYEILFRDPDSLCHTSISERLSRYFEAEGIIFSDHPEGLKISFTSFLDVSERRIRDSIENTRVHTNFRIEFVHENTSYRVNVFTKDLNSVLRDLKFVFPGLKFHVYSYGSNQYMDV